MKLERTAKAQGTIRRALLLAGLILLVAYAGYRIQGVVLSRLAVQSFETAARSAVAYVSDLLSLVLRRQCAATLFRSCINSSFGV